MMNKHAAQGVEDALRRFEVANTPPPGILDRLKSFGQGQWGAAKDLVSNLRGGMGGQMNPNLVTGPVPAGYSTDLARGTHRQQAIGNLKTLAPTLAAGGGLYMLHRHNKAKEQQEAQQRAMMMQQGYGQPM